MRIDTVIFLVTEDKILLAMKKRGFGAGRWNGAGGKVEPGETVEQALIRECQEEIEVTPVQYEKMAEIIFDEQHLGKREKLQVHVYICTKWQGGPTETEEMRPKWFNKSQLPFDDMWDDDKYWLQRILAGEKLKCEFTLDENDKLSSQKIIKVEEFL